MLMLSSCKKTNSIDSTPASQIWPFEVGNTWVYVDSSFDTTGALRSVVDQPRAVTIDLLIAGERWYHMAGDSRFYTNRSDGLWVIWDFSDSSVHSLLFKYPCKVGDTWKYGRGHVTVLSTDTTLTVPSGTYHCYEYLIQYNSRPEQYCYLYPGVGFIRTDHFLTTSSGKLYKNYTSELKSVTIK